MDANCKVLLTKINLIKRSIKTHIKHVCNELHKQPTIITCVNDLIHENLGDDDTVYKPT